MLNHGQKARVIEKNHSFQNTRFTIKKTFEYDFPPRTPNSPIGAKYAFDEMILLAVFSTRSLTFYGRKLYWYVS